MKIAYAQMKITPGHPDINTKKILQLIEEAKAELQNDERPELKGRRRGRRNFSGLCHSRRIARQHVGSKKFS